MCLSTNQLSREAKELFIKLLSSKIHRARVTDVNLDYEGSISIDETLLEKAGIVPYQAVNIFNLSNGNRFETYVITAQRNSGTIGLNGAAARLAVVGDLVIIVSYVWVNSLDAVGFSPKVVMVDESNMCI